MMSFELNGPLEHCSVVVVGNFNPPIFHPEWFSRHGIMPGEEVESLISEPKAMDIPEISLKIFYGQRFLVDNDQARINFQSLNITVTRNRFEVRCQSRSNFPLLLKFLRKVFKLLPETPITAYGINFEEDFTFDVPQEQLIDKFFTKKATLTRLFGDDTRCGYTIFSHQANAKLTFEMRPSERSEREIRLKANFHYEDHTFNSDFFVETVQKNFHEALHFTEKAISQHFGNIV